METLTGEITTEKGFLKDVEKKVFKTEKGDWVSEEYMIALEQELYKAIDLTKKALKLSAADRERIKNLEGTKKENPESTKP